MTVNLPPWFYCALPFFSSNNDFPCVELHVRYSSFEKCNDDDYSSSQKYGHHATRLSHDLRSHTSRVRVVVNHHYVHKRYNDIHSARDECTCHTFAANCSGGASALPVQRICGFKLNLEQYARIYPIYILKIYEKYTALHASSAAVNAVHHRWPSRETFLPENGCCGRTG